MVSDQNLYIDDVKHKTYIDGSERGTEAAVTLVAMKALSFPMEEEEKFEMIVNRPFFFIIEDSESDEILFI